jgi:hypothetical protein
MAARAASAKAASNLLSGSELLHLSGITVNPSAGANAPRRIVLAVTPRHNSID